MAKEKTIAESTAQVLRGKNLVDDGSIVEVQLVKVSLPMEQDPDTGVLVHVFPEFTEDGRLAPYERIHLHGTTASGQDVRFWVDHTSYARTLKFSKDMLPRGTWTIEEPRFVPKDGYIATDEDGNPVLNAEGEPLIAGADMFLATYGEFNES